MSYQAKVGRKQGATEIFIDAGGRLNAASGSVVLPPSLKRGYIPLDIFSGRILSSGENYFSFNVSATGNVVPASGGGMLHAGSVPSLTMNSSVNKAAVLTWASGQVQVVAFPPIPIPMDFSSAGGLTLHAIAERASDNASDNVLDFRFWNGSNASNKGTTGSTLTSTPAEYSAAVSSAEAGGHPGYWNIHLVPGTHTNNAVRVFSAWAEYDKATS